MPGSAHRQADVGPQPARLLYAACVVGGQRSWSAPIGLASHRLDNGSTTWTQPLPAGMPGGRGLQSGDAYFLPTTAGHLLKFNITRPANSRPTSRQTCIGQPGGYQDQIISAERRLAVGLLSDRAARDIVAARLKDKPGRCVGADAPRRTCWRMTKPGRRVECCAMPIRSHLRTTPSGLRWCTHSWALETDFKSYSNTPGELEALLDQPRSG